MAGIAGIEREIYLVTGHWTLGDKVGIFIGDVLPRNSKDNKEKYWCQAGEISVTEIEMLDGRKVNFYIEFL